MKKNERETTHESGPRLNLVSVMPVLFCRHRSTSVSFGVYVGVPILSASVKKLFAIQSVY